MEVFPRWSSFVCFVDPGFIDNEVEATRIAFYRAYQVGGDVGFIVPGRDELLIESIKLLNEQGLYWDCADVFHQINFLFFWREFRICDGVPGVDENSFLSDVALVGGDEVL